MKQTNERLCALAQKGDAAALDSLIDNNKSFIGKVANDLFRSMNLAQSGLNLDTDDLKQAGNMGLWKAVPKFDAARGMKFLTYAAPIQSYVLRNQDELTNYARKVIEEHPMGPLEWNGWKVYYYADDMVEFCTGSFGLIPSTTYKGFYYSEDDEPHGFQDVPVEFVKVEMDGRGQNQKVIIHNILNELQHIGICMK